MISGLRKYISKELILCLLFLSIFWLPRFDLIHKLNLNGEAFSIRTVLNLLLFDFVALGYLLLPVIILAIILPDTIRKKKLVQVFLCGYLSAAIFIALLCCISEFFFIDEFSARYNFIAVDYLVYTSEVLKNIWESYSILPIIAGLLLTTLFAVWGITKVPSRISRRGAIVALAFFATIAWFVQEDAQLENLTESQREVSKNSFHALFAAFRNNQLDFEKFYPVLSQDDAIEKLYSKLTEVSGPHRSPKHWNVIVVAMESMSARYLKAYGGASLTPNLDAIREQSLTFDNMYATGTRTVRGLEAIMLSLPPTPGQSILRRPKNENLFSIGSVLKNEGYDLSFIYGGRAFFDNMRAFFESNSFRVIDQTDFASESIHFSNAWGVCDEDTFDFAIGDANETFKQGKPFFQLILTTSNHRPYTFPANRIERTSVDRESAVNYSDYAIGHFLENARKQPWFDETLFIFVADHDAAVSGGTKILPEDYHIPLMIYAPKLIAAKKITKLASQMDLAPTVLGLLGLSYQSRFFGHDLMRAKGERAFMGTYQKLAYLENGKMVVLSPPRKWEEFQFLNGQLEPLKAGQGIDLSNEILKTAVAYYQTASAGFKNRWFGLENKYPSGLK